MESKIPSPETSIGKPKDQFFSGSDSILGVSKSIDDFSDAYSIPFDRAKVILGHRKQAQFYIDQTINYRNSPLVGNLTKDSLTGNGMKRYKSYEEYKSSRELTDFNSPPMTVSELVSRVTHNLGGSYSKPGKDFFAISNAMDNFFELKRWHKDLYDSALDFLLRSEKQGVIAQYSKTGKFPRDVTESKFY